MIEAPPSELSADASMARLLCLMHLYFGGPHCEACERKLRMAIHHHLLHLANQDACGPNTVEACRELARHWRAHSPDEMPPVATARGCLH